VTASTRFSSVYIPYLSLYVFAMKYLICLSLGDTCPFSSVTRCVFFFVWLSHILSHSFLYVSQVYDLSTVI